MKRPRDYSDTPDPWNDEPLVDETYFGSPELPILKPIIIHLLVIAFVLAILGWYFWPEEARADQGLGEIAIRLPWLWAFFVAGIVAVFALGLIQIFDAIILTFREHPSRATAAAVVAFFVIASIGSAFSHEAPTGWSYSLSCCWSPSNAPAGAY